MIGAFDNRVSSVSLFQFPQSQAEGRQLLLDFVEAGLAEVFAAKQFILGARGEFTDGIDVKPLQRFSAANGQFEVADRLAEQFGRHVGGRGGRGAGRFWIHPPAGPGAGPCWPEAP